MPQKNKNLQADFPKRARAARRKATAALKSNRGAKGGQMSLKERAGHQKAAAAADRVLKRTSGGKAPSSSAGVQPGKPKSKDILSGIKDLFRFAKGVVGLPGKEKKELEGIERKTRKK